MGRTGQAGGNPRSDELKLGWRRKLTIVSPSYNLLRTKQSDIREKIRNADKRPFMVCMDDGTTYKVTHPDFALLAPDTLIIAASPDQSLGGKSLVLCMLEHISRIGILKKKAKAK